MSGEMRQQKANRMGPELTVLARVGWWWPSGGADSRQLRPAGVYGRDKYRRQRPLVTSSGNVSRPGSPSSSSTEYAPRLAAAS